MIDTYSCRVVERCKLPRLSVHICSISDEELNYFRVSFLIYQDYHTMYNKFNPKTITWWMIGKHICGMFYLYIYQHNCLYTYFRHGNYTVDDFMTIMIDTYICREINICIFYQHKNVYLFSPGMVFILLMIWYVWYSYVCINMFGLTYLIRREMYLYIYIYACTYIYLISIGTWTELSICLIYTW